MSFVISKNKISFVADNNEKNLSYSNPEPVYIAYDSQQVIGEVDVSGAGINHFIAMVHLYCPGVAEADIPDCRLSAEWDGGGETTDIHLINHIGSDSGQSRGGGTFSFKDTLINVQLMILPNQAARNSNQPFTIPANSQVLFSLQPQDSVLSHLSFTGPSVPVRFAGLPDNLNAAIIHPEYPDVLMGFKGDAIHYQSIANEAEHTTTGSIAATFPEVSGTVQYVLRSNQKGLNGDGHNIYWYISIYNTNLDYFKYEWVGGAIDNYEFVATATHSWLDYTASGEGWQLNFKDDNGLQMVDALGNTGDFQPYGPGTSLYPTLPNTSPVTAVVNDQVNNRVIAMIGDKMYSLTGSPDNSVTETWTYG